MDDLMQHMNTIDRTRLQELFKLAWGQHEGRHFDGKVPTASLRKKAFDAMITAGLAEKHSGQIGSVVRVWERPEHKKHRGRIICWTKEINEAIAETYSFMEHLDSIDDIKRIVEQNSMAAALDLKAAYYQHEIPPEFRKLFVFKYSGGLYHFTRLSMGTIAGAEIQQRTTRFLAGGAASNIHIDNILVAGNQQAEIERQVAEIKIRAKTYGATLNPDEGVQTSIIYFGVHMDFKKKIITLSDSTIEKVHSFNHGRVFEFSEFLRAMGLLFHIVQILETPLTQSFHLLKQYRILAADFTKMRIHMGTQITLWAAAHAQLQNLIDTIIAKPWIQLGTVEKTHKMTIWTDASNSGYGAVAVIAGKFVELAGKWSKAESSLHINTKEMLAVQRGLEWAHKRFPNSVAANLCCDNTCVVAEIKKKTSRNYVRNRILQHVLPYEPYVTWIPSHTNVADRPSRLSTTSQRGG